MPAGIWLQLLNLTQPSKVALAGTATFQAGLLLATLQYNDTGFGLRQCPLVASCAQDPPSPRVLAWSVKHAK
eukprot:1502017-Lingulodinium_polyedra.AAC.1